MKWVDISSYSQSDKERIPRSFSLKAGGLKITVTRHMDFEVSEWVASCEPFFEQKIVGKGTAEEAQESALFAVRNKLNESLACICEK
jgi:hypothetical protein